jgi:hypothetical protein
MRLDVESVLDGRVCGQKLLAEKRAFQAGEPALLPFVPESPDVAATRAAERRSEEECLDLDAADLNQALVEIDLKLPAGWRLEPPPPSRLGSRAEPRCSVRRLTPSAFSARRSRRTTSALPRCRKKRSRSQASSPSSALARLGEENGCTPFAATYRLTVWWLQPKFRGNPLLTTAARLQPQHRRYVVWRLHHVPLWIGPQGTSRDSALVHSNSPQLREEGAIPRVAKGAVFHAARH